MFIFNVKFRFPPISIFQKKGSERQKNRVPKILLPDFSTLGQGKMFSIDLLTLGVFIWVNFDA